MKHRFFSRALIAGAALAATLSVAGPSMARDWDNNPPGWRGGPGTNWENPPGWRGGPGASPDRRWYYERPHRHWARDRDDNPPGRRGGPGTNWENRPGWRDGPGASPDRWWRGWR
ncbi:MAG: hypothetical protein K0S54_2350 [Alphaproteobacteria bacterium]|jgi:hypothetical protein|nr:hypothetical protein [Alphaproteobacteria bacterium]